jgi:hypothetical protein
VISDLPAHLVGIVVTGPLVGLVLTRAMTVWCCSAFPSTTMTCGNNRRRVPFPVSSRPLRVWQPLELQRRWVVGLRRGQRYAAGESGIRQKLIAGAASAIAVIAALTACSTATTAVVHTPASKSAATKTATVKPAPAVITTVQPKPAVTKAQQPPKPAATPTPAPAASTPAASTPAAAPAPGYLGDIFGGGAGNPCNFASGYQLGVCNPTGETEQQYIDNPGGPAPGTSTNAQGCYYVKMGEGYCPSTGQTIPMQDPNSP